ncbi:MAG: hypothetical protein HZB68_02390 [Candidatus Aenigmarchaeota archaeon]|nr:hypothetical protein [Candidatus Aenigmarchaeota archaeon]
MRKLYYVPTIHFYDECSEAPTTRKEKKNKKKVDKLATKYWTEIISILDKNEIDAKNMVVFQDGMTCDDELCESVLREIAKEVKTLGKEYIVRLLDNGARSVKTEDEKLITEHRWLFDEWYDNERNDIIMDKRDVYVAGSINTKLKGVGIAFMGASHQVPKYLDKDIEVIRIEPFGRLEK